MKNKIEKYTSEFRKEAVRLALQTEQPKTKNQNITVKYQNLEEETGVRYIKKAAAYFGNPRSVRYAFIKKQGVFFRSGVGFLVFLNRDTITGLIFL